MKKTRPGLPWWLLCFFAILAFIALLLLGPVWLAAKDWPLVWTKLSRLLGWIVGCSLLALGALAWLQQNKDRALLMRANSTTALRAMSWQELEILVRAVYARMGYHAERTKAGADGGVDVVLYKMSCKTVVQCKQWKSRTVGINIVRELLGSMTAEGADAGVIITCGTFTRDSQKFAQMNNIDLIDGIRFIDFVKPVRETAMIDFSSPSAALSVTKRGVVARNCPKCKGSMVVRIAANGVQRGSRFLGCSRYPVCNGTRHIDAM